MKKLTYIISVSSLFLTLGCTTNEGNKADNLNESKDWSKEPIELVMLAAEDGVASAQYTLGMAYYSGDDVDYDGDECIKWLRKASMQGNIDAQYWLAYRYKTGYHVKKSNNEARLWVNKIRKVAESGDVHAKYLLGRCYDMGVGVLEKNSIGIAYIKEAAEQGDDKAQYYLASHYCDDDNFDEAAKWFKAAMENGNEKAIYCMGYFYLEGKGVTKDSNKAAKYLLKAAKNGDENAQYWLYNLYHNIDEESAAEVGYSDFEDILSKFKEEYNNGDFDKWDE